MLLVEFWQTLAREGPAAWRRLLASPLPARCCLASATRRRRSLPSECVVASGFADGHLQLGLVSVEGDRSRAGGTEMPFLDAADNGPRAEPARGILLDTQRQKAPGGRDCYTVSLGVHMITLRAVAAIALSVAAPVIGQSALTGIRVTPLGVDSDTLNVELGVTVYTTGAGQGIYQYNHAFLGDSYDVYVTSPHPLAFHFRVLNPAVPAIQWGDGETLARATAPLVATGPPRTYGAAFSHTYPAPGDYEVSVGSFGLIGRPDSSAYENPRLPPVAGDALYTQTVQRFFIRDYGVFLTSGTETLRFDGPRAIALTDSTPIDLLGAVLEVPNLSSWGLASLAGALLAAGWLILRLKA